MKKYFKAIVGISITLVVVFFGLKQFAKTGKVPPHLLKLQSFDPSNDNIKELIPCELQTNCVLSVTPILDSNGVPAAPPENGVLQSWKTKENSADISKELIKNLLSGRSDAVLRFENKNYLHYEFKTPLLGYTDDVEFLFNDDFVSFRSASRLGTSDLGANRKRMLEIEFAYHQTSHAR